jgi:hypothetical protein
MQLGENFVLIARHGKILQKICGAAIQMATKRLPFPEGHLAFDFGCVDRNLSSL